MSSTRPANTAPTAAPTPAHKPEILAPAGDEQTFLAALAAGADAVYAGLKHFSARMQAANFSTSQLGRLVELARGKGVRTYVAMNTLVKPGEEQQAGRLIDRLERNVHPDALICQDLAMVRLAREVGFSGEVHLSTLANVSHPAPLPWLRESLGISRVIIPRELNVDEVRTFNDACPEGMSLEYFVHGARCYGVSGRCLWSSLLGGKSGLRGRCVQPCRRKYDYKGHTGRYFSCLDVSLDLLAPALLDMPKVVSWKIEGRKKGPHYVYYTVSAYKLLRDSVGTPDANRAKKTATSLLEQALSRPTSRANFLPQRPHPAVEPFKASGSGLFIGRTTKPDHSGGPGKFSVSPRDPLLAGDLLRIGYEDDPWHMTFPVRRAVPKGGRLTITPPRPDQVAKKGRAPFKKGKPVPKQKKGGMARVMLPRGGTPVFLIDRREKGLVRELDRMREGLAAVPEKESGPSNFSPKLPPKGALQKGALPASSKPVRMQVHRAMPPGKRSGEQGLWVSERAVTRLNPSGRKKVTWWLPPVVWPSEERALVRHVDMLREAGVDRFVLNAPWQRALFAGTPLPDLWAGPFCNVASWSMLAELADLGFVGAFAAMELTRDEVLALPQRSPIKLGIVTSGWVPFCLSRFGEVTAKSGKASAKEYADDWDQRSGDYGGRGERGDQKGGKNSKGRGDRSGGGYRGKKVHHGKSGHAGKSGHQGSKGKSFGRGGRQTTSAAIHAGELLTSPREEPLFALTHGQTAWVYPNWTLDLSSHETELATAGYSVFVTLNEPTPKHLPAPEKTTSFNWDMELL